MSTVAIGTPSYGGKKKENSRLKDGDNIYRILPPLGELAAEGVWAVYECLHWGFKGTKGMRPFRCIQKKDFNTKMVKVQCPECDRIAEKLAVVEDTKAKLKADGKSKEFIDEHVKPLTDWLYSHNLDKKWYVNALTMDGKITRLAIPHKMYVQLQEKITELVTKKGIDPIAVDGGVWFNLKRTGMGNQTAHSVSVEEETVMAEVNGKKTPLPMIKQAPLTQEIINRLGAEAHDLKNSFRTLSFDDIKRLVTSGGDPEVVDAVFSAGEFTRDAATPDDPEPGTVASTVGTNNAALAGTSNNASGVANSVADDAAALKAKLEAQMAALKAQLEAAAKPAAPAASGAGKSAANMTDDEFIKQFGFTK